MKYVLVWMLLILSGGLFSVSAQQRAILVPHEVKGSPFSYQDQEDYFGQAYRWFYESVPDSGIDALKKLLGAAGVPLAPENYYVVVAQFTDEFVPIGLIHEGSDFFSNRMYGLKEDNLFYVFISRTPQAPSFLSVLATEKSSPFVENLPGFLNLLGFFSATKPVKSLAGEVTWIDVRQFDIPETYRKFCDLSFMIKKSLSEEEVLVSAVFDNTAKERWSYGVGFALTSVREVDIIVGSDGRIIVRPKPQGDAGVFGLINYHFTPVDTKAKTFGTSFHLLAGLRIADMIEPLIGIGGGVSLDIIDLHAFVGYSVAFVNELKAGYFIGQQIESDVDPFKLKIQGHPRFGIEVKFP